MADTDKGIEVKVPQQRRIEATQPPPPSEPTLPLRSRRHTSLHCPHPSCNYRAKTRRDVDRHNNSIHKKAKATRYYCQWQGCLRNQNGWTRKDLRDRHEKNVHAKGSYDRDKVEPRLEADSPPVMRDDDSSHQEADDEHPDFPVVELWMMLQEEKTRCERLEKRLDALQRRYDEREDKWFNLIVTRIAEKGG